MPADSAIVRWSTMVNDAFTANGRPLDSAHLYEQQLADAGFVNIHVVCEKWPVNRWPKAKKYKQLGTMSSLSMPSLVYALLFICTLSCLAN